MNILPKEIRLGDTREARQLSNEPFMKKARRKNSAKCVQEWKDLKNGKRFALPALARAYAQIGLYLSSHVTRALHRVEFAPHAAIPDFAYTYTAAHVSQSDPAKIACYPTIADAKRGREIVMSPGKFFAAIYPDLSASEIQRMAEKYACAISPPTVHIADDEDSFSRVYASARGFSSCMAGAWDGDEHTNPVRFYAHDDNELAIAYLTHNGKPRGETVARTIVNTAKKLYVRVYGDARLASLLEADGYSQNGARALQNQKCNARTNDNGYLVAPYLDAVQRISWDGSSDFCRISSDGNYDATNTGGTANEDDNRPSCERCGEREDEDDMCYSDWHEINLCSCCADNHYTYAIYNRNGDETYVRNDEVISVGDQAYLDSRRVLEAHDIVEDEDGEWQHRDDCIFLEYRSEYVLIDQCTELDFPFGDDNYARDCDLKTVHVDGEEKTVHEDWDDEDGITDEWKAENPEDEDEDEDEDSGEDLGKFPAAHARPVTIFNPLDETCRTRTAFASFADLLNAADYRPSINVADVRLAMLADAYDKAQEARGDSRRAYRYANPRAAIETENQEATV